MYSVPSTLLNGFDWDYWETHIQRALDWLPLVNDSVEE